MEEETKAVSPAPEAKEVKGEVKGEVQKEEVKGEVKEEEEVAEEKEVAVVGEEGGGGRGGEVAPAKKNRIQVSTNKKPLYFYVNLAKRYMQNYNEVELSALGMAIGTVVTVAEILKNNGLATEKKILTSTIGTKDESKGRLVRKAKIEILLGKSESFNNLISNRKADRIKAVDEEIKV